MVRRLWKLDAGEERSQARGVSGGSAQRGGQKKRDSLRPAKGAEGRGSMLDLFARCPRMRVPPKTGHLQSLWVGDNTTPAPKARTAWRQPLIGGKPEWLPPALLERASTEFEKRFTPHA